ncbi:MAG TPA: hypothetical protein VJZ49_09990 [Syntrophales bacterium]|nr:hypothetical protein [Syntrophales bacterium]
MVHRIPDCGFARSYIIEEDDGLMVIDVGSIGAAQMIDAYCTQILNRPLRDIRIIAHPLSHRSYRRDRHIAQEVFSRDESNASSPGAGIS